jgi:DNA-binding transcriptional regulator YiaG
MIKFDGLGLDNVWLTNGYRWEQTCYGAGLAVDRIEALEAAVATYLAKRTGQRLTGQEFRFLRDMLDMSQAAFGIRAGRDYQTVARWEAATRRPVPAAADAMIRQLYLEKSGEQPRFTEIVEGLAQAAGDGGSDLRLSFRETADGDWENHAELATVMA